MDIMRMHEMIEKLSECAKCEFDKGVENIDAAEMSEVVDMLKDLSEAMYYRTLTVAMQESNTEEIMDMFDRYGEDRRYYDNYRYKTSGRFAPKGKGTYMPRRGYDEPPYYHMMPYEMSVGDYKEHSPEYWRDFDRKSGRLYYTEPMTEKRGEMPREQMSESRYDRAKRMYTETKDMHKSGTAEDKAITLKEGEKMLNVIFDELEEIMQDASPEMRSMVKTKGLARMQKIQ